MSNSNGHGSIQDTQGSNTKSQKIIKVEGQARNVVTTTSTAQVRVVLRQPVTYDGGGHAMLGRNMRSECVWEEKLE